MKGFCECGCGGETAKRFLPHHHQRTTRAGYVEEDRGFDTPCWIWQTAAREAGYAITTRGRWHRLMYEEHRGQIPDGLVLDHLCRVKSCVNPDHLEPVTQITNCRRGRQAKLTEDDVREIRGILRDARQGRRKMPNGTLPPLAERYGVSLEAIKDISVGRSWAGVE
jgi:hypothetical protein